VKDRVGAAFLSVLVLAGGCRSAAINRFDVLPIVGCKGDSTRIDWDVVGHPWIEVAMVHRGSASEPDTVVFTLTVTKGRDTATDERFTARFAESFEEDVVLRVTEVQSDSLVAAGPKNPTRWDERFVVETVSSPSSRPIRVSHAGRSHALPGDGTPVTGFQGTAIGGEWEFRSPVLPGETIGGGANPPPGFLRVRVSASCIR
jgi:hypothetical protein